MNKQLQTKLDYNNGTGILEPGDFRISASGIADYFSQTNTWYRDNLMGESSFNGSQATLIGSLIHFCAEQYAKQQTLTADDRQQLSNYLTKSTDQSYADHIEGTNRADAEAHYKIMGQTLINDYVATNMPCCVEPFIAHEVLPGIYVGGSVDNLTNGAQMTDNNVANISTDIPMMIVDYKSTSTKPTSLPSGINFKQRLQLLTYAFVLKKEYGITTDRIRIVYTTKDDCGRVSEKTGKPLKDYPSEVKVLTEQIVTEDYEYIESIINTIAHSVKLWNTNPELRYALAQDWRLKA